MNEPVVRILCLYMFGISLHRWFSPSTLTANIAIQAGSGSLLFMLAIQLTMALFLLYNSGVRPMYHQRWHRKIRNQVRLSAVYAVIVVLSGIFQTSLNKQLEAEIYEIGQMQLKQQFKSFVTLSKSRLCGYFRRIEQPLFSPLSRGI